MRDSKYKTGFTLIEVLIAVLLVGLAIASLVGANSAFTQANGAGTDLSTAEFLLEQIKELTATLPVIDPETEKAVFGPEPGETLATYDDLDDFDNKTFSPPINANGNSLDNFASFSQVVTVQNVNSSDFEQVESDHSTNFVRVTVKVFQNSVEVCSASWLRASY
ncbi:MAG: prepilin-type N-terminal cleavage/methylation domain-containing protein [Sedimentisphaerales bacterium]|jgi:prepilin-type N-terminal cleavage/methylation domain-containing protein